MGSPAARLTDRTAHGGMIVLGKLNVWISYRPAARLGDPHVCPPGHYFGPIMPPCAYNVLIGGKPAARIGDKLVCGCGAPDVITSGEQKVLIGTNGSSSDPGLAAMQQVALIEAGLAYGPGPMSQAAAAELFRIMAAQPDIAFRFPVDGCYSRTHIMAQRMAALGAEPGKAWTFASGWGDPLWVSTPNHPDGRVEWGYHVAPTIPVQQPDGTVQDMVVDPSMFDHPVTVQEWAGAQHDRPDVVQTRIGEAPRPDRGGSGYWPGPDPAEGPDAHARETMEEYKRLEGTRGR